ncbi:hypothetical protein Barb6XT_02273 [Bacteroidales bacterium Barb6XT]|nr:hypothetical protein Barb6XT_02273 [Bacteroidales bacterium Barb6XT]
MTFALVTEGISEYRIIRHLLLRFFKGDEEPEINQMQPHLTDNEKKQADGSTGGWVEVLKYCENEEALNSIFIENDYLVIQIDTDCCETCPFNVLKRGDRQQKSSEQLFKDVRQRLTGSIPQSVRNAYLEKIVFAICIDTIECWLLPLYYDDAHKCKTTNCLSHLNDALRKKNMHTINTSGDKNNANSRVAYTEILKGLSKKADIETHSMYNYGFKSFVGYLKDLSFTFGAENQTTL